jgi:hypothetical protein
MLVVTDSGTIAIANHLATFWSTEALECRLFDNDYIPTTDTVLANLHEASFPGYSRFVVPTWAVTGLLPGPHQFIQGISPTFTASSFLPIPQRQFGYYIYWLGPAVVIWAERFPRRFFMSGPDTPLSFSLRLGLLSEFTG